MKSLHLLTLILILISFNVFVETSKGEVVAKSENVFNISVEYLYNCSEVGYLHYNLSLDGEVGQIKMSRDKKRVIVSIDYKQQDDSIRTVCAIVDTDAKTAEIIDEDDFNAFGIP